jgi:hypothetical protein
MRTIDHVIVGHSGGGASRTGEVFDPNKRQSRRRRLRSRHGQRRTRSAGRA